MPVSGSVHPWSFRFQFELLSSTIRMLGAMPGGAAGLVKRSMSSARASGDSMSDVASDAQRTRIENVVVKMSPGKEGWCLGAGRGDVDRPHAHADALDSGVVHVRLRGGNPEGRRPRGDVPCGLSAERVAHGRGAGHAEGALLLRLQARDVL